MHSETQSIRPSQVVFAENGVRSAHARTTVDKMNAIQYGMYEYCLSKVPGCIWDSYGTGLACYVDATHKPGDLQYRLELRDLKGRLVWKKKSKSLDRILCDGNMAQLALVADR